MFSGSPGLPPLAASGTLPPTHRCDTLKRLQTLPDVPAGAVHEMARGREPLIQPMPLLYRDGE